MFCEAQLSLVSCSCEYCSSVPSYLVSSGPLVVGKSILYVGEVSRVESHMTYCITVFGTVSKTCTEKLFKIQKHCIRILFGDIEKYLDKFRTSARTRPFEAQRLGAEFFCKEHVPNHCLIN